MSILDEIFAHKRREVEHARQQIPLASLESAAVGLPDPPSFSDALRRDSDLPPRLIAEVKQRSPSRGVLRADFDPLDLACVYAGNGAAAISVLTDEKYFGGSLETLRAVAALGLGLPLLRKDFVFDYYQLLEARLAGASAVLLIAAMLEPVQLAELLAATRHLDLEALVEIHTQEEAEQALGAGATLVGVNNRNLRTFNVSLETTLQLRPSIPTGVLLVAESGIRSPQDVERLARAGVDAILVGESLVAARDVAAKVRQLAGRLQSSETAAAQRARDGER